MSELKNASRYAEQAHTIRRGVNHHLPRIHDIKQAHAQYDKGDKYPQKKPFFAVGCEGFCPKDIREYEEDESAHQHKRPAPIADDIAVIGKFDIPHIAGAPIVHTHVEGIANGENAKGENDDDGGGYEYPPR